MTCRSTPPRPGESARRPRNTALGLAALGWVLCAPGPADAAEVPRFASMRAAEVNVRAGPGVQYPIAWVFLRRGLPVEVVAEFEHWRKVRDRDGAEGWVHRSLLSGRRSVVVRGKAIGVLYRDADATSVPVARVEPGVVADLLACHGDWCRVEAADLRGWIARARLWGVYPAPDDGR